MRSRSYKSRIWPKGFTLVELLIVCVTLAVISLAIYTTFANGIKIWRRATEEMPEEGLNIFFEKFEVDLKNALRVSNIGFMGGTEKVAFATMIRSRRLGMRTVGKVRYSYDRGSKVLAREEMDYSHLFTGDDGISRVVLEKIQSLKFYYYIRDPQTNQYLWQEEMLTGELPIAVQIEIEARYGSQTNKFVKIVGIPVSN